MSFLGTGGLWRQATRPAEANLDISRWDKNRTWQIARASSADDDEAKAQPQSNHKQASANGVRSISPLRLRRLERKREKQQAMITYPTGEERDISTAGEEPLRSNGSEYAASHGQEPQPASRGGPRQGKAPKMLLRLEDLQAGWGERAQAREERRERLLSRLAAREIPGRTSGGLAPPAPLDLSVRRGRKGVRSKSRRRGARGDAEERAVLSSEEACIDTQALAVVPRRKSAAGGQQRGQARHQFPGDDGASFPESEDEHSEEDPDILHPISDARLEWGRAYTGSHRCQCDRTDSSVHCWSVCR